MSGLANILGTEVIGTLPGVQTIKPANLLEVQSREAVREAVAFGFGIGVVFAAEFRPEAGLKRIVITGADFDVGEYIVCRAERQRLPLVRSFFEMVQDVIETR